MAEGKLEGKLGSALSQYREGNVNHITFVVTEECNLRCRYCYMVKKNNQHIMPREVAFKAVDFILDKPNPKSAVVLEFIGGEPTLEIDLIKDIIGYFRRQITRFEGHPWQSGHLFLIGTNGTTYSQENLQRLLWEHQGHIQCALTIDGTKRKHDMHRVFKDGQGSYDTVLENAKLWVQQNPYAITKVTFILIAVNFSRFHAA